MVVPNLLEFSRDQQDKTKAIADALVVTPSCLQGSAWAEIGACKAVSTLICRWIASRRLIPPLKTKHIHLEIGHSSMLLSATNRQAP